MKRSAWILACMTLAGCASSPEAPTEPSRSGPLIAARSTPRSFADFRPSAHGFAFVNHFEGSPLPIDLGGTERRLGLPDRYGLCGGMSFGAADYFLARMTIPADAAPPAHGTPLYRYLYARQATSVGPAGMIGLKFMDWMRIPDDGPDGARARTAAELPGIRAALERGEPVVLGLVLTISREHAEPWNHNHQVLAYGVAAGPAGVEDLRIYDPNFPRRDDAVIRIATEDGLPRLTRLVPGRRETPIRGMFRMAYATQTPAITSPTAPSGTSSPPPAGSPRR